MRSNTAVVMGVACAALLAQACCGRERRDTTAQGTNEPWGGQEPKAPAVAQPQSGAPMEERRDWSSRLDGDMKKVIDKLGSLGGKPIETLSPVEARQQPGPADAIKAVLADEGKTFKPEEVGKVENRSIAGPGGQLPVRIVTPKKGKAPYPVIVYYHGGGFVIANNDAYDASIRGLSNGAEAVVVSVDYRQAPENKFPAAHDDAWATYQWAVHNAGSFGGDASRVAVVGESAGGNLAENVAIAARDKGEKMPSEVVLVYPIASSNLDSLSERENVNAKPLNRAMMSWFSSQYFNSPADGSDPRIDLLDADLHGLPQTTVILAEIDPLRSDGEALAKRLKQVGVDTELKTYDGVTHEFFGMGAVVDDAKDAMNLATRRIKKSWDKK